MKTSDALNLKELIVRSRSYRRFDESVPIGEDMCRRWIDLARLSPSAANRQPLRFMVSCEQETNSLIFPALTWAAYLQEWSGPVEGQRPAAYLIVLVDKEMDFYAQYDCGIACQSILLGATADGFGGCIILSVSKEKLKKAFEIPENLEIMVVVALGKPKENIILEPVAGGNIRYYRDEKDDHHVPKRGIDEIVLPLKTKAGVRSAL